jgi:hypothetical protein
LARGIARNPGLRTLAANVRSGQQAPNLLPAAVRWRPEKYTTGTALPCPCVKPGECHQRARSRRIGHVAVTRRGWRADGTGEMKGSRCDIV